MDIVKYRDYSDLNKQIENYLSVYTENTRKAYTQDVKDFLDCMGINLFEMKEKDIIGYMNILKERGCKNSTFNRKLYSLQKVSEIFVKQGLMNSNPVKKVRELKKIDKPVKREHNLNITVDDVKKVIEQSREKISLIVLFLTNTGCRIQEMIDIELKNIEDFKEEYKKILITGKGNKERYIYLKTDIYKAITGVYNTESVYLFHSKSGNKLDRSNIYKQVEKAFNKIGKENVNPHKLRHLFCQYKINNEKQDIKAVSLYVGHSSVNITLDYYCNNRLLPEQTGII